MHAHLAGHAHHAPVPDGPSVDTDDHDRAVYVNAFMATAVASFSTPDVVVSSSELPVPVERAAHRPVDVRHSHDPPALASQSSRAPPLFLS
jgi:hypothetical protein